MSLMYSVEMLKLQHFFQIPRKFLNALTAGLFVLIVIGGKVNPVREKLIFTPRPRPAPQHYHHHCFAAAHIAAITIISVSVTNICNHHHSFCAGIHFFLCRHTFLLRRHVCIHFLVEAYTSFVHTYLYFLRRHTWPSGARSSCEAF